MIKENSLRIGGERVVFMEQNKEFELSLEGKIVWAREEGRAYLTTGVA